MEFGGKFGKDKDDKSSWTKKTETISIHWWSRWDEFESSGES